MSSLQNRSTGMNHPNPPVGLRTKQGAYPNHILEQPLYSRPGSLFNRLEIRALFPWGDGRWLPNHGPSLPRAAPSMLACVVLPRSLLLPTDRRARPGDVRRWTDPGRPMHQRTAEMLTSPIPRFVPFPFDSTHLTARPTLENWTHTHAPPLSRGFFFSSLTGLSASAVGPTATTMPYLWPRLLACAWNLWIFSLAWPFSLTNFKIKRAF